jgi:hypothetical protein
VRRFHRSSRDGSNIPRNSMRCATAVKRWHPTSVRGTTRCASAGRRSPQPYSSGVRHRLSPRHRNQRLPPDFGQTGHGGDSATSYASHGRARPPLRSYVAGDAGSDERPMVSAIVAPRTPFARSKSRASCPSSGRTTEVYPLNALQCLGLPRLWLTGCLGGHAAMAV